MEEKSKTPASKGRVADATDLNWVDRFAPEFTRPYLRLSRADRPAGTWLLLIPCFWGLALALLNSGRGLTTLDVIYFVLFAVGAFLMRGAGCTWNDITDQDFDAKVARTKSRPIPSGQVTVRGAAFWMCIQAFLAALILLSFNLFAAGLAIASLLLVAIYPFTKRFTWWPQVFLGLAFNWGALLGWAVITGGLSVAPVCLYLAGILWTLFYDTIYAHQDKEDDALIGVKSTARLFGDNTRRYLLIFLIGAVVLMGVAVIVALPSDINPIALVVAIFGIWGFGMHMTWQLRRLDIDDPDICLQLFRSNRDAGLIPAGALLIAVILNTAL
ncbi:MAG: 4-hydroxybenzoate octaprenyltransferase [Pseudomonadota bacterium]